MIALIPARAGSRRVPGKNTRLLAGHPLVAYSIAIARQVPEVTRVIVSSEDEKTGTIAEDYGAEWDRRDPKHAAHDSPDIDWIRPIVAENPTREYCLLRPTSPFRDVETIRQAYLKFRTSGADSLRTVEPCSQHPGKMWHLLSAQRMVPLMPHWGGWSRPTQTLPAVYVQNASLEIFTRECILALGSLSGFTICPWVQPPPFGFDINTEADWAYAEAMAAGSWALPTFDES